jgi:hypothetical protein
VPLQTATNGNETNADKCIKVTYKHSKGKGKGPPQQAEVAQGVPGRLRPRIFLTFGTTRVVGRQTYAPGAFTPGKIISTVSLKKYE